jgi:hypothetical protein
LLKHYHQKTYKAADGVAKGKVDVEAVLGRPMMSAKRRPAYDSNVKDKDSPNA